MRFVDALAFSIYEAHMSPTLNGSSAIRRFERSYAIEIRNGITFDFYTGLPHIAFCALPINHSLHPLYFIESCGFKLPVDSMWKLHWLAYRARSAILYHAV